MNKKLVVRIKEASDRETICTAVMDRPENAGGYVRLQITDRIFRWIKRENITVIHEMEPYVPKVGDRCVLRSGLTTGPLRESGFAERPLIADIPRQAGAATSSRRSITWDRFGRWLSSVVDSEYDITGPLPERDADPLPPVVVPPLKLEIGGWYICRNGMTAGPMSLCQDGIAFYGNVLESGAYCWNRDGTVWNARAQIDKHPFDLICRTSPKHPAERAEQSPDPLVRFLSKAFGARPVLLWLNDSDSLDEVRALFPTIESP